VALSIRKRDAETKSQKDRGDKEERRREKEGKKGYSQSPTQLSKKNMERIVFRRGKEGEKRESNLNRSPQVSGKSHSALH